MMQTEQSARIPIRWVDSTLESPASNLALDEVLLNEVDASPTFGYLRTWEPPDDFIVMGRSNRLETEVNVANCQSDGVQIYRRASGGGTVLLGPGCLAFSIVLPNVDKWQGMGVSVATHRVMQTMASGLSPLQSGITVQGISDLVVNGRKFSGNAQRWLRHAFLHHGTLLYNFDLSKIERLLKQPSRQPDYRAQRLHIEFVTNLSVTQSNLTKTLVELWKGSRSDLPELVIAKAHALAQSKYKSHDWSK